MNMNIASLIPTIIAVLMMITTFVQAAPKGGEKGGAETREEFFKAHPELKDRLEKMTPEESK